MTRERQTTEQRPKYVVIVAHPDDIHAKTVGCRIEQHELARSVILNSADFPSRCQLSFDVSPEKGAGFLLQTDRARITNDDLLGVWWRRSESAVISSAVTDPRIRRFCAEESRTAFRGWLMSLGDKVVNPLAAEIAADNKAYQLAAAHRSGLRVPCTTISNSPTRAKHFIDECTNGAVYKILTTTPWHITETRLLSDGHVERLGTLRHAPTIFQECIAAECDIRATVVDTQVFAVSLHSRLPPGHVDWRLDIGVEIRPHDLPERVGSALAAFCKSLGLRYGAIDLRLTPDGEYIFLEVNTGGQFLFAEIHGGQQISDALARALCRTP